MFPSSFIIVIQFLVCTLQQEWPRRHGHGPWKLQLLRMEMSSEAIVMDSGNSQQMQNSEELTEEAIKIAKFSI